MTPVTCCNAWALGMPPGLTSGISLAAWGGLKTWLGSAVGLRCANTTRSQPRPVRFAAITGRCCGLPDLGLTQAAKCWAAGISQSALGGASVAMVATAGSGGAVAQGGGGAGGVAG